MALIRTCMLINRCSSQLLYAGPETHFARGSGEGWSGEERRVLNRFVGGMAIVKGKE